LFEDGMNINENKLTIKHAIDYIADAWSNVSEVTITNCWKKTGILPIVTENDIFDAMQVQQDTLTHEKENTDQLIIDNLNNNDPYTNSLSAALNEFFYSLDEEIPTEDILNENDIIDLIQNEMRNKDDDPNHSDDSEEEPELISLSDARKSLYTWITFCEQQQTDEFKIEDINMFKKHLKIIKRLEFQAKKQ
ncbi:12499_t:CDS:1, partial [Dentiscutata heterogama]